MEKISDRDSAAVLLSVDEFCALYGISRTLFYAMLKSNSGPPTLTIGRRRLIMSDAAKNWARSKSNDNV